MAVFAREGSNIVHDNVFRKGLVVLGLILSIGGISVLRYLLISDFRRKK